MSEQEQQVGGEQDSELGFERLVFFSDAVMAIAITLMALEIRLPELEAKPTPEQISAAFQGMIPHIEVYILSFLVIGLYWMVHHRLFRAIRGYNGTLIWLNLIFLMTVGFLPVATNALGIYPNYELVTAFYAVSLSLVGFSEFALWLYALRKGYLRPYKAKNGTLNFATRILIPPIVFLLSVLIIPFNIDVAKYFWAVMIPILFALKFIFPGAHAEHQTVERKERA